MKLLAFRIQNFKSIIDSGWCNLSKDGVTCLIGQNESGKSSVLEALHSFGAMEIEADFIRSDNTTPIVSCKFEVDEEIARRIFTFVPESKYIDKIVDTIRKGDWIITKTLAVTANEDLEFIHNKFNDELEEVLYSINKELLDQKEKDSSITTHSSNESLEDVDELDENEESDEDDESEEDEDEDEDEEKESFSTKQVINHDKPYIDLDKFITEFAKNQPSFIFFNDESNLLPNEMDLDDILSTKSIDGKQAVLNLLKVGGIDIQKLKSSNSSTVKMYMNSVNKGITARFQDFWTQQIGKGSKISIEVELKNRDASYKITAGKPYLEFWIKDDEHILHPKQRSKGVRWFLSFYLSLKADSMENRISKSIFLIDEPGANLHARAQEDVLRVFEDIKQTNQVMYSTHSQHLIEFKNLHRLLAVQRKDDSDDSSDTIVLPAYQLGMASTNTLAPILEHMGIDLSNQNVISKKNNILLEEISAYYYLLAFEILTSNKHYNYLPATGVTNIEQLALLLTGWGINFGIVFDDDSAGRKVFNSIKKNLYQDNDVEARKNIYKIKGCDGIEDLFSQNDFYKILLKNDHFTSSNKRNSELAKNLQFSKPVIALEFYLRVKNEQLLATDLESETVTRIKNLMDSVNAIVANQQ